MNRVEVNLQTKKQTVIPFTAEELAAYTTKKAEMEALAIAKTQAQAAYDAAAAVFSTLSIGKQTLWEPVRKAVGEAILAGDMATAKEILLTVPALYEDAEEDRKLFLSLFP